MRIARFAYCSVVVTLSLTTLLPAVAFAPPAIYTGKPIQSNPLPRYVPPTPRYTAPPAPVYTSPPPQYDPTPLNNAIQNLAPLLQDQSSQERTRPLNPLSNSRRSDDAGVEEKQGQQRDLEVFKPVPVPNVGSLADDMREAARTLDLKTLADDLAAKAGEYRGQLVNAAKATRDTANPIIGDVIDGMAKQAIRGDDINPLTATEDTAADALRARGREALKELKERYFPEDELTSDQQEVIQAGKEANRMIKEYASPLNQNTGDAQSETTKRVLDMASDQVMSPGSPPDK